MPKLWRDFSGEPYLVNPRLTVVSNRRVKKVRRKASRKSRSSYRRRNYMSAGVHPRSNRPARRKKRRAPSTSYRRRRSAPRRNKYLTNPRRRVYRRRSAVRNPRVLGFELPSLRDSLAAGAGFLLPPVLENIVAPFLPAILTTNTAGRWALRIGSVAAVGASLSRFVGRREGSLALIGGGVWLVSTAVNEFMPGLLPGLSGQPLLGGYTSLYQVPANLSPTQTAMTYDEPDRLQPTSRF